MISQALCITAAKLVCTTTTSFTRSKLPSERSHDWIEPIVFQCDCHTPCPMSNKHVMFNQDLTFAFWVHVLVVFLVLLLQFLIWSCVLATGQTTRVNNNCSDRVTWRQWWWSRPTMSAPCKIYAMTASSIRSPLFSIPLARSVTEPPLHSWRKQNTNQGDEQEMIRKAFSLL